MTEETALKRKGSNRHKLYGMSAELNRKVLFKNLKFLDIFLGSGMISVIRVTDSSHKH